MRRESIKYYKWFFYQSQSEFRVFTRQSSVKTDQHIQDGYNSRIFSLQLKVNVQVDAQV